VSALACRPRRRAIAAGLRSAAATALLGAAVFGWGQAAPAIAQEPTVALPDPILDMPATVKRREPRKVMLGYSLHEQFVLTLTQSMDGEFGQYLDVVVFADCDTKMVATLWVEGYGKTRELGEYRLPPTVQSEIKGEDQSAAKATLGLRNLQTMCSLK